MPTNENALREQGESKKTHIKTKLNFNTYRGLHAYENQRKSWLAEHPSNSEMELLKVCLSIAKACGLKLIKAHQCLSGVQYEYH